MTIISSYKIEYQRKEPRIVKLDAVKEAAIIVNKLGNRRDGRGR